MARVESQKRILSEDFPSKYKDVVDPLAYVLNPFMEQVAFALNGNLDFTNQRLLEKDFTITVDYNGVPVGVTSFLNTTRQRIKGMHCIYAINKLGTDIAPEATPFLSFQENQNVATISRISGLVKTNPITDIIVSNPGEITSPNHGLKNGHKVVIFGTSTTPSINGNTYPITVIDSNTFSIPINITAVTANTGFWKTTDNTYSLKFLVFT